MKANRAIKIIASVCFALLAVALLVIRDSPATAYEPSIYATTPPLVWGCLIFSIVCGIGIVVHQVWVKHERHKLWIIGLALVLLSNTIILSLHILRGYAMWSVGDAATHLGYIKDIIATGHFDVTLNFYPVTHIYLAQLSQLWNVEPLLPHQWVPVYFALLYMVFIYFVARALLPQKGQVLLATVAGTALVGGGYFVNLTPNNLASLAFPLAFYLLIRSFYPGTLRWKMLFLIMIFLFPAFHPLPAFALLVILLALWLPRRIWMLPTGNAPELAPARFQFNATVALLLFVWTITWLSSFGIWDSMVWNTQIVITEGGQTRLTMLMTDVERMAEYGYSLTAQFFKIYTSSLLYIILALAAIPILWKRLATDRDLIRLATLYGPIAVIGLFVIFFYFFNLYFGPLRLLFYIVMMCIILVGFVLFEFIQWAGSRKGWLKKAAPFLIAILLVGASVMGILQLYPSPYILDGNWQVTRTQISGIDYYFHHRNTSIPTTGLTVKLSRYADFLLTPEERSQQEIVYGEMSEKFQVPYHFGYDKHSELGESYTKDAYLLLDDRDRSWYVDLFPQLAEIRFMPQDYERLEDDPSVDKLYSNNGLDVWYIHSRR